MKRLFIGLLCFRCFLTPSFGQLAVSRYFGNDMILQRDRPIHIWGKGSPGTKMKVAFGELLQLTWVLSDSTWSVTFDPQGANPEPQTLEIAQGSEQIRFSNILIGDIWLCLGQSNMEWQLQNDESANTEIPDSELPDLRLYNPWYAGKSVYKAEFGDSILSRLNYRDFYSGTWEISTPKSAAAFSAVGYFFGKEIQKVTKIPIGLINLSIGGAPIEAFISPEAMSSQIEFAGKLDGNWLENEQLPIWIRSRGHENVGGQTLSDISDSGPNHAFKPAFAFESGIRELTAMPISGIIWYQGESNAQEPERVEEYGRLQQLMVSDYRSKWNRPELPFYWVQLSSIDTVNYQSHYWPEFRNKQFEMLNQIPFGGMAVSLDIGARHDVHPRNKKDVGRRLARWALRDVYKKPVVVSGPLPKNAVYREGTVSVAFEYPQGLKSADESPLLGFSLDGRHPVSAQIVEDNVLIPAATKPEFVYYAWEPWVRANLINGERLPAPTFKIAVE